MTHPDTLDQPPFGRLQWNHDMRWWERDRFALPLFSGAEVELYIPPAIAAREPMPAPERLSAAGEAMLALTPEALAEITPHVWANYRSIAGASARGKADLGGFRAIWDYVRPYTLTVQEHAGCAWLLFECDCGWNREDGLQLVLLDGWKWVRVSPYDGCLTDGEAAANPALDDWLADPSGRLPPPTAG